MFKDFLNITLMRRLIRIPTENGASQGFIENLTLAVDMKLGTD